MARNTNTPSTPKSTTPAETPPAEDTAVPADTAESGPSPDVARLSVLETEIASLRGENDRAMEAAETRITALRDELQARADAMEEMERHFRMVHTAIPDVDKLVEAGNYDRTEAIALVEAAVATVLKYRDQLRASASPSDDRPLAHEETGPYVVLEDKRINYGGGLTVITTGTRVDMRSYGRVGIMRLREQGVKMRLLPRDEE